MIAVARWLRQRYRRTITEIDCFAPDGTIAVTMTWGKG